MMERILLFVLFLSGWKISTSLQHQYHYVSDSKNWTEAQTFCRETYTDLATIENTEEMKQLINTVSSAGYNSDVWVGLYSKVEWKWSDGYTGSGAEFRSWETSDDEPDFVSANQFCVIIGGGGGWWDDDCSLKYPLICYRGTQLEPEYVLVNEAMNWSSAQRHCRENFIDLVTVRNDTENTEIQNLVPSGNWAWTGLSRDPNFYWSDQSNFSFSNLDNTANLIGSMRIICGVAALHRSGKWRFLPCERRLPFVCHSIPPPPVKRQVVKLKDEGGGLLCGSERPCCESWHPEKGKSPTSILKHFKWSHSCAQ
ncbi:C-type mannose receptor 2-like [Lates calcarifer]|uniref:C-type mannose receptor 2-like n=1 Tax=Lates calcarifer TaxID=8187 RepID=A0AAJ8BGW7_LATCA|nr:C-type mannose receptor 2-like [Lates calcarifer]